MLGFDWMERNLLKSWVLKWLNNEHGDGKSETRIWKEVYSIISSKTEIEMEETQIALVQCSRMPRCSVHESSEKYMMFSSFPVG